MRLTLEKTVVPGIYVARLGDRVARIVAHVCNGRGVYGFDEEHPSPDVEAALARRSDKAMAILIQGARELGK